MSIGVPIKVLHEAEGHIVTCETNTGEVYRGKLIEAEDNMNCQVLRSFAHIGTLRSCEKWKKQFLNGCRLHGIKVLVHVHVKTVKCSV